MSQHANNAEIPRFSPEQVEVLECPYLPIGWTAVATGSDVYAVRTSDGLAISFPKVELEILPTPFGVIVDDTKITGSLMMRYRICPRS